MSDDQRPRVSIGLPVHNGELYLRTALESLLSQTFPDFELIISDNCSTDTTGAICAEFAAQDPRFRIYQNERNIGAAANYNRVVALARGDYFVWANHDDMWGRTYLEDCLAALERHPEAVLAFARSVSIDECGDLEMPLTCELHLDDASARRRLKRLHHLFEGRRPGESMKAAKGLWIPVYGLMRLERLRNTGLIGAFISADTVLIEELLMLGPFVEVEKTLFFKREHPGRSMRACEPYDKRFEWFTARSPARLLFPRARLLLERLRATLRASVPLADKVACFWQMLSYYVSSARETKDLFKEVRVNVRRLVGSAARETW